MCKKFRILFLALAAAALTGCGQVGLGDSSETEPLFTTTSTYTTRAAHTTKTAMYSDAVDADDEDYGGGYTTTTTVTGSLENGEVSNPDDEIDEDLRSTMRTEAKTFYTVPEHNGTTAAAVTVSEEVTTTTKDGTIMLDDDDSAPTTVTTVTTAAGKDSSSSAAETTTTAFDSTSLFKMETSMEYDMYQSYTVTSDTTYLNLRYGPSKQYDIRLQIPDGETITGWGETVGTDGNVWVYTSYNGTVGWVMRELLAPN